MNLICPHCQKTISVADNLAGQTTNCPQCQGPFTVPLPPKPAPPPPPAAVTESPMTAAYSPPPTEPQPEPAAPPPPPPGDYRRMASLSLQPRIVRWIAPACFLLIFLLMFFPWVGMYYGSYTVVRQLGVGVAFGAYDGPDGKESLDADQRPGVAPFALLYFLFILASMVLSAALVVMTVAPHVIPPEIVQKILPWRSLALAGLSLLTLLCLLPYVVFRTPLESNVLARAEKDREAAINKAKDSDKAAVTAKAAREYGIVKNSLQRRMYFRLVIVLNFLAVLGALADLWLEKRPGQPLPRATLEW